MNNQQRIKLLRHGDWSFGDDDKIWFKRCAYESPEEIWEPDKNHNQVQEIVENLSDSELQTYFNFMTHRAHEHILAKDHGRKILTVGGFILAANCLVRCEELLKVIDV